MELLVATWTVRLALVSALAVGGISLSAGGILGALFLSGIERRFGIGGALVSLAIPGLAEIAVAPGPLLLSGRNAVVRDVDEPGLRGVVVAADRGMADAGDDVHPR